MLALTNTRSLYQSLSTTYVIVGSTVFAIVLVALLTLLALGRRRARKDQPAGRRHEGNLVEGLYVLGLVGIVIWLLTMTFHTTTKVDDLTPAAEHSAAARIDAVAAQWNWRFVYPGKPTVQVVNAAFTPTQLYVPANQLVLFTAHSQDVLHAFWIPYLRFQRWVWPDHVERFGLVFPHVGTYRGLCAWFCGLDHDRMDFTVHAMAPRQFRAWLARKRTEATDTTPTSAAGPGTRASVVGA